MAIDFPASPTLNQQFTSAGSTWLWDGVAWNILPQMTPATASDTPPANPAIGQGWWRGTNGKYYLWLDDGSSKQWVEIGNAGATPGAWEFIEYRQVSGNSYSKNGLDAFEKLKLTWDIYPTTATTGLNAQFSSDNGATWIGTSSYFYQYDTGAGAAATSASGTVTSLPMCLGVNVIVGGTGGAGTNGEMIINRFNKPLWKTVKIDGGVQTTSTGTINAYNLTGGLTTAPVCNAILIAGSQPLAGTVLLEGVRG